MMRSRFVAVLALTLACAMLGAGRAAAQQSEQVALAGRRPRFIEASDPSGHEVDLSKAAVLLRRVSLDLADVTVDSALKMITQQAQLRISYSEALLPAAKRVTMRAQDLAVAAALTEILLGTGLDVAVARNGRLAIVAASDPGEAAPVAAGTILGRITDKKTGAALAGATVALEGTPKSGTTGNDGRYRIAEVAPGAYTVRARYIGYTPGTASVTVSADQEATADFTLEKSVQRLDEVVTTGTVVPTEVKALPTPVTVITDSLIALQRPHTVQELFRQSVPTGVSWDWANFPAQKAFSVRGASTLSPGSVQMKVFVDGIQTSWANFVQIDLNSIERIEIVRGPQASAIYGSDAIGGVMQIFTKRGDPSLNRPQMDAEAALGVIQTPYAGQGGVLRQAYTASVRGGTSDASYSFGAGYSHTGDYLPNGELSAQSNPHVYGGIHLTRGVLTADVSGRYDVQNNPIAYDLAAYQTGFVVYSKPFYERQQYGNQAIGVRLQAAPTNWWKNTVTVGIDRVTLDVTQMQPRLTTPDDTLLFLSNRNDSKTQIGYNTLFQTSFAPNVSASIMAGFDHFSYPSNQFYASALQTTGTIPTTPSNSPGISRTITNNTGYFTQVQLGFRDALFLTGGLRAEQNSDFGDSLGTPVSPRVGLAYAQPVNGATLKFRGSWGRAIRAPSPGAKSGRVTPFSVTLENPALGPERQRGWDAGVDVAFGSRGSLSLTYYDQTAENLIQFVQLPNETVPTYQNQNVGRVNNTGIEVEGTLSVGPLQVRGNYGYARARVDQLGPNYTGDLRVNDQVVATPKHTGGASLTLTPRAGLSLSAGMTYVGTWNNYDFLAFYRCLGGTGPCQPTFRDYIIAFPGFAKVNATISQQLAQWISGFMSVDNLTNKEAAEYWTFNPVMGRITTLGLRFAH